MNNTIPSKTKKARLLIPSLVAMSTLVGVQAMAKDDITTNIVGGHVSNTADWQFYTQILSSTGSTAFCGGSYIGEKYVLTAAHCVRNKAAETLNVKVAGFKLGGTDGDRISVNQVFIHPQYDRQTIKNDVALLELSRAPRQGSSVAIAQNRLDNYALTGDILTVAGLGRLQEGGLRPTDLHEVDVPLVSDAVCRQAGGPYNNVGSVEFCAGFPAGQKDSCSGDSGGPIVVRSGGQTVQLGIVSWGIGCARPNNYGVYADVAALHSWISSVKNGTVPVSVGFQDQHIVPDFVVGDRIRHTFDISNTGTKTFTFTNLNVASSGTASGLTVTRDTCSATTLLQNQSCAVSVEFTANTVGQSNVALNFNVDGSNTNYVANLVGNATDGSNICHGTWDANAIYQRPDRVTYRGTEYEAKWWTQGDIPSESGLSGPWKTIGPDASCR